MAERDENHETVVDEESHERTFEGFVRAVGYASAVIVLVLVFLALAGA